MTDSPARVRLRRELEAHMTGLGYDCARAKRADVLAPEIVRASLVRGRIAYGETVLRNDLRRRQCHERLLVFSRRRTRRHSSILFFIGVAESDQPALEALLQQLDIRSRIRGGHVHVVPIAAPATRRRAT
ncbi:MAG TPA: hypothetical protein VL403_04225 [Candidatus Kryptonia bacterium]|nr:hypothetical protein [Candidatus Kryptonia bacterium]